MVDVDGMYKLVAAILSGLATPAPRQLALCYK